MFFAATENLTVVGYQAYMVAFDSKKRRDTFCKNMPIYKAISSKDAKRYDQEPICRKYCESVYDLCGKLEGIVLFTKGGDYYGIA